ncbi:hypothetical protein F5Y13DRAFT_187454 [Hypoxylon sp. FL1857]|nr:hypothetical protein F5Y13DRAFT_187454 [Hypoxylon sp. FL1857]
MWFPRWENNYLPKGDAWARCLLDLELYWSTNTTGQGSCNAALNCILRETDEAPKQMLAASMVLLGLMPGILAMMSPSTSELAMLSLDYLLLPFLLAFGASAAYVPRLWDYSDPLDAIEAAKQPYDDTVFSSLATLLRPYRRLVVIIEYLLGLVAVANVIHVSLYLGWRSVSSWDCNGSYLPLGWPIGSLVLHCLGMAFFWLTPRGIWPTGTTRTTKLEATDLILRTGAEAYARRKEQSVTNQSLSDAVSTSDGRITLYTERTTIWTLALQNVATGCAIGHLMYAAVVFSSLMFFLVTDAIFVILRYAGSAVVCRTISRYELAVMSQKYRVERVEAIEAQNRVYVWTWRS